MSQLVAVGTGGAIGAILRHLIGVQMKAQFGDGFPYGTLTVNLLGCFLIGLLFQTFSTVSVPAHVRLLLITGLLGALTTFSTYGLDTVQLIQRGAWETAVFNLFLNNFLGILLVLLGIVVARTVL